MNKMAEDNKKMKTNTKRRGLSKKRKKKIIKKDKETE